MPNLRAMRDISHRAEVRKNNTQHRPTYHTSLSHARLQARKVIGTAGELTIHAVTWTPRGAGPTKIADLETVATYTAANGWQ